MEQFICRRYAEPCYQMNLTWLAYLPEAITWPINGRLNLLSAGVINEGEKKEEVSPVINAS